MIHLMSLHNFFITLKVGSEETKLAFISFNLYVRAHIFTQNDILHFLARRPSVTVLSLAMAVPHLSTHSLPILAMFNVTNILLYFVMLQECSHKLIHFLNHGVLWYCKETCMTAYNTETICGTYQ